jgi:uncharacterized protein (TIGR01777 family)
MKVLITGGSGTLGKEIANLVFKKKYEVNILTRNKNLKSHNPRLKYFYWNPKKEVIDLDCFKDVDSVINLAGFPVFKLWTKANKTKIFDSRVGSTNFILDIILKKEIKIKSFVNASAIAAYRDSSDFISSENDSINNPNSFINQIVVKWEDEVKRFESKLPDISFSIMRIGLVLSNSGGLYKICRILSKLFLLSPLGSGNQWQSWIHEQDAAKIILLGCENSWKGTYNLVAPKPVKQNELINKIAIFNKSRVIFPNIPSFMVRLVFGEMSEVILSSQKVKSVKLSESDFSFKHIDDALKDLSKNMTF